MPLLTTTLPVGIVWFLSVLSPATVPRIVAILWPLSYIPIKRRWPHYSDNPPTGATQIGPLPTAPTPTTYTLEFNDYAEDAGHS